MDYTLCGDLRLTDLRMDFTDLTNDMNVPSFLDPAALSGELLSLAEREAACFIFNNPAYQTGDNPRSANFFACDIASYSATVAHDPSPVPLPASLPLMTLKLGCLGWRSRVARRNHQRQITRRTSALNYWNQFETT